MIVVVIIGVLAAIAAPRLSGATRKAREAEAGPILKQICMMQYAYFEVNGSFVTGVDLTELEKSGWDPATLTGARYYTTASVTGSTPVDLNVKLISSKPAVVADQEMRCIANEIIRL
jgi:type II secretory pathway pseudopilin PulG